MMGPSQANKAAGGCCDGSSRLLLYENSARLCVLVLLLLLLLLFTVATGGGGTSSSKELAGWPGATPTPRGGHSPLSAATADLGQKQGFAHAQERVLWAKQQQSTSATDQQGGRSALVTPLPFCDAGMPLVVLRA